MDYILYLLIFCIGTLFGSFFTLAVYRIPLKQDITHTRSYCPNCNHKLDFWDMIPILSYIFIGGKCRYCKQKIRPRYLILEILTGITFLTLAFSVKLYTNNINNLINLVFLLIYVSVLFIVAGIDKENVKIEKSVLIFGFVIELLYIIYQYTLANLNVYQYVMYFITFGIILLILNLNRKNTKNINYIIQILYLSLYMIVYSGIKIYFSTLVLTLVIIYIKRLAFKTKQVRICFGFYLSIINILIITISNIITNYII